MVRGLKASLALALAAAMVVGTAAPSAARGGARIDQLQREAMEQDTDRLAAPYGAQWRDAEALYQGQPRERQL